MQGDGKEQSQPITVWRFIVVTKGRTEVTTSTGTNLKTGKTHHYFTKRDRRGETMKVYTVTYHRAWDDKEIIGVHMTRKGALQVACEKC